MPSLAARIVSPASCGYFLYLSPPQKEAPTPQGDGSPPRPGDPSPARVTSSHFSRVRSCDVRPPCRGMLGRESPGAPGAARAQGEPGPPRAVPLPVSEESARGVVPGDLPGDLAGPQARGASPQLTEPPRQLPTVPPAASGRSTPGACTPSTDTGAAPESGGCVPPEGRRQGHSAARLCLGRPALQSIVRGASSGGPAAHPTRDHAELGGAVHHGVQPAPRGPSSTTTPPSFLYPTGSRGLGATQARQVARSLSGDHTSYFRRP